MSQNSIIYLKKQYFSIYHCVIVVHVCSPIATILEEPREEPRKHSRSFVMQFTEKYIQALKSKSARYDVREKSGDGFAIRVSPSGEKSWVIFYFFEGKKRRMTLGSYPVLPLAEARKRHRKAVEMLAHNKDPGLTKQREKQEAKLASNVKDLITEYIEKWAKPRKRSWQEDERILNKDVLPALGKHKARNVTKRDIILLLDKIKERNAPIAANRTLACVRRMFNFAIERDIIAANPCATIKAPAKENQRDRCLSELEIKNFWHGLDNASMAEATKLALKLQLVTAQRKGEIINAEWSEIDLTAGWWTIPAAKAKNGRPHRVPLSKLALQLLEQIKQLSIDSQWLFPSPRHDKPITGPSIDHAVRRSLEAFKEVKPFTPHDLRRTAASHMTAMQISRLVASKLLNHVESSVTAVYDRHTYDSEKQQALELWEEKLRGIINGTTTLNKVIFLKNAG